MKPAAKKWCVLGVALWLACSIASCASDGGVGGTGISTLQGNVTLQAEFPKPSARGVPPVLQASPLAGIVVREPGTGIEDETDEQGEFRLEGAFPAETTLEFFVPEATDPLCLEGLYVPLGATLTLEDVLLTGEGAAAEQIRVSMPAGTILADAVCTDGVGEFELEIDQLVFTILIGGNTSIGPNGRSCENLTAGSQVFVLSGTQQGLLIEAESIKIGKSSRLPTD